MYYVYVLGAAKRANWHYYGVTADLKRRFSEHSAGKVASTRHYRPLTLLYYEAYRFEHLAKQREDRLKSSRSASTALLKRIEPPDTTGA